MCDHGIPDTYTFFSLEAKDVKICKYIRHVYSKREITGNALWGELQSQEWYDCAILQRISPSLGWATARMLKAPAIISCILIQFTNIEASLENDLENLRYLSNYEDFSVAN